MDTKTFTTDCIKGMAGLKTDQIKTTIQSYHLAWIQFKQGNPTQSFRTLDNIMQRCGLPELDCGFNLAAYWLAVESEYAAICLQREKEWMMRSAGILA